MESSNISESTSNSSIRSFSLPSKYCKISDANRSVEKLELDVLFKDWHVDKLYRCEGNNTNEKRYLREAKDVVDAMSKWLTANKEESLLLLSNSSYRDQFTWGEKVQAYLKDFRANLLNF